METDDHNIFESQQKLIEGTQNLKQLTSTGAKNFFQLYQAKTVTENIQDTITTR